MSDRWLLDQWTPPLAGRGWYATADCWDIEEGGYPSAHFWTGEEWDLGAGEGNLCIQYLPRRFDAEDDARAFAEEQKLWF